jgi:hypothetical protein
MKRPLPLPDPQPLQTTATGIMQLGIPTVLRVSFWAHIRMRGVRGLSCNRPNRLFFFGIVIQAYPQSLLTPQLGAGFGVMAVFRGVIFWGQPPAVARSPTGACGTRWCPMATLAARLWGL